MALSSPAPRLSAASDLIAQESPAWICQSAVETPRCGMQEIPGFCEKAQQKHLGWICCGTDEPWGVPGFLLWMILGALPTLRGAKPLLPALPSIPQDTRAVTEGLCPPASARNSSYSWDWLFRSHRDILKDQFLEYNQSHRDLWGVFQNLSEKGFTQTSQTCGWGGWSSAEPLGPTGFGVMRGILALVSKPSQAVQLKH